MISISDTPPFAAPPAPFNMAQYVLSRAAHMPQKEALCVLGADAVHRWSFGALEAAILGTATGLLERGLTPGDRILMRLGNTVEFPIVYLACIAVGLVPVPTSSQLTKAEVDAIVAQIKPALVVQDPTLAAPASGPAVLLASALDALHSCPPAQYALGDPGRLAYIIFTSGTSGKPRAVCHAHRAIWARQMMFEGWYGLRDHDRILHAGAFNWTYTLGTGLMDPWTVGATALIPAAGTPVDQLAALIARHDASLFAAAPGVYRQMLKQDTLPAMPALRHGLSAGERLPETTRAHWETLTGTLIHEAYGMSECSTFVSASPAHPAVPGTSGRAQEGRRVAILGPDGPVPHGSEGVIAIHRADPGLMVGYLDQPDETAARFQGDWFLTGDTGCMAADGAITYLGRADDMMNAGGYRVSPLEVEAALNAHPDIIEAAAIELRVKADASIIAAVYVADRPLDDTALNGFASQRLARYKMPRRYIYRDTLPKSANGKLNRKALRAQYEADHG
ncbi:MAG: class I adenylate-forming enzyme family protein [Pseudomonadota bacterium]